MIETKRTGNGDCEASGQGWTWEKGSPARAQPGGASPPIMEGAGAVFPPEAQPHRALVVGTLSGA